MSQPHESCCIACCYRLLDQRGWQLVEDRQSFCGQLCADLLGASPSSARWKQVIWGHVRLRYSEVLYRYCGEIGPRRERAFEELGLYLYGIACRRLSDWDKAQDLTQTALERVLRHYQTCRCPTAFLAWCAAILRYSIYDQYRAGRGKRSKDAGAGGEMNEEGAGKEISLERLLEERGKELAIAGAKPEHYAELRDVQRGLVALLQNHIPGSKQQVVAILSFVYGWKPQEIAEVLEIPPYQVRLNKSKALSRLRQDGEFQRRLLDLLASER